MYTLYEVIGVPLVLDSDQATFTVSLSIVVTTLVGVAEMNALNKLNVLELAEYPYSFLASILNSYVVPNVKLVAT